MPVENGLPFQARLDEICIEDRDSGSLYGNFTLMEQAPISNAQFPLASEHDFVEGEILSVTPVTTSYPSGGSLTRYKLQHASDQSTP